MGEVNASDAVDLFDNVVFDIAGGYFIPQAK
jgi:hypothetical protein